MENPNPKKLLILGGTGPVGRDALKQCVENGFECSSMTRDLKKKLPPGLEKDIKWFEGDVADVKKLEEIVKGQDAVYSCIGTAGKLGKTTTFSNGIKNILEAMEKNDVKKLVFMTALHDSPYNAFVFKRIIKPYVLNNVFDDMDKAEDFLKKYQGNVDWTVSKPCRVLNKPSSPNFQVMEESKFRTMPSGSKWKSLSMIPDINKFALREILENKYAKKFVVLGE